VTALSVVRFEIESKAKQKEWAEGKSEGIEPTDEGTVALQTAMNLQWNERRTERTEARSSEPPQTRKREHTEKKKESETDGRTTSGKRTEGRCYASHRGARHVPRNAQQIIRGVWANQTASDYVRTEREQNRTEERKRRGRQSVCLDEARAVDVASASIELVFGGQSTFPFGDGMTDWGSCGGCI